MISRVPTSAPLFGAAAEGGEGGEGGEGEASIEDVLGLNVPVTPQFLLGLVGNTGFETTFEDERIRITRGGSGAGGVWGGFRVFTKV